MYSPVTYFSDIFLKNFIHVYAHACISCFHCCIIFHCITVPQFYPLFCLPGLGLLFSVFTIEDNAVVDILPICNVNCVPCLYSVLRTWLTQDRYSINVWGMWCFLYPSPCMCSSSRTAVLKSLNICSHDATEPFVPFTAFHSVRIVLACGQARMCVLWIFKSPL